METWEMGKQGGGREKRRKGEKEKRRKGKWENGEKSVDQAQFARFHTINEIRNCS